MEVNSYSEGNLATTDIFNNNNQEEKRKEERERMSSVLMFKFS